MINNQHLVMVKAVNFDQVLDDTDQISIRRGAGLMLRQAPKEVAVRFDNVIEKTISTGASIGIYLLKNTVEGATTTKEIQGYLQTQYPHITFVVVSQAYTDGTNEFRRTLEKLYSQTQITQLQQLSLALPTPSNNKSTDSELGRQPACSFDHVRPAMSYSETDNINGNKASRSSLDRFNYGRNQRSEFYKEELQGIDNSVDLQQIKFTDDLNALTKHDQFGNLSGKMALIYVDGNKFTNIQKKICKTIQQQQDFDNKLQSYHREFLRKLIKMASQDLSFQVTTETNRSDLDQVENKPIRTLRIETLMWGGDELLLVVPAWRGMAVMQLFLQLTKQWEIANEPLKYDCGLVFCSHNTPIVQVRDLARELADGCKESRKKISQENIEEHSAAIFNAKSHWDYLVLESIDYPCESINSFYQQRYGNMAGSRRALTDITELDAAIDSIKTINSKRQLYALAYELIKSDPALSLAESSTYQRMQTLLRGDLCAIIANLAQLFPDASEQWRWLHFLELYDYLAPQPVDTKYQREDNNHE